MMQSEKLERLPVAGISIVVPVYEEEASVRELASRLFAVLPQLGFREHEVLFVCDGSTDGTEDIVRELAAQDASVKGIFLSRNFGHQAALWTGIQHATGDVVALIDGDLQDPPEALVPMIDALASGADVAYGVRKARKEPLWKRAAHHVFYRLMRWASSIDVPLDSGDFCCMRRRVVDAMAQMPETTRFLRGLRAWVGFRQVGVEYERAERFGGSPGYSLAKLVGLAYDGLFAFSFFPIRIMQVLGLCATALALTASVYYAAWYFVDTARFPSGFATIAISLWLIGGLLLLFLGIVGEYVARGLSEVRHRPVAIVRERIGLDAPHGS